MNVKKYWLVWAVAISLLLVSWCSAIMAFDAPSDKYSVTILEAWYFIVSLVTGCLGGFLATRNIFLLLGCEFFDLRDRIF